MLTSTLDGLFQCLCRHASEVGMLFILSQSSRSTDLSQCQGQSRSQTPAQSGYHSEFQTPESCLAGLHHHTQGCFIQQSLFSCWRRSTYPTMTRQGLPDTALLRAAVWVQQGACLQRESFSMPMHMRNAEEGDLTSGQLYQEPIGGGVQAGAVRQNGRQVQRLLQCIGNLLRRPTASVIRDLCSAAWGAAVFLAILAEPG